MHLKELDHLEQQIAEMVIDGGLPIEAAIGMLCRVDPARGVDVILLAAISVVVNLDEFTGYTPENTVASALHRHRMFSAFSADLAGLPAADRTCRALVRLWKETGDTLFGE